MRLFLLLLSFTLSGVANCQKLYGTVYTQNGDLLPYSSITVKGITVKGTSIGASANDKAKFSFTLSTGNYTIVCQHIGLIPSFASILVILQSKKKLTSMAIRN